MREMIKPWNNEYTIPIRGGAIRIVPGHEMVVQESAAPAWAAPITSDEIGPGDVLCYEGRPDGERIFIGGPWLPIAFVVNLVDRSVVRIPLLRYRDFQEWDVAGSQMIELMRVHDGRLVAIYESGIFLLDRAWDVQWHRQLPLVHFGFFPDSVDSEEVWLNSDWGQLGYRLEDGSVLDPDGNYAWRERQQWGRSVGLNEGCSDEH